MFQSNVMVSLSTGGGLMFITKVACLVEPAVDGSFTNEGEAFTLKVLPDGGADGASVVVVGVDVVVVCVIPPRCTQLNCIHRAG